MSQESSEFSQPSAQPDTPKVALPGVGTLFAQGWRFVRNNPWLVVLLATPMVLMELVNSVSLSDPQSAAPMVGTIAAVSSLIMLLVYVLFVGVALYLVTQQSQTQAVTFNNAFAWAKQNYLSLIWISILSTFVVWGGMVLLIVPGIIIAIYISLTQIVLAAEGKTGLSALLRSREIVYGNWLAVFGRIIGVQLLYFLVILAVGVVLGSGSVLLLGESAIELATNLIFTVLGAAGTLILLNATWSMYSVLAKKPEATLATVPSARTKYMLLGWLGLVLPFLLGGLLTALVFTAGDWGGAVDDAATKATLSYAQFEAEQYYTDQPEMTYAGVCMQIEEYLSGKGTVACNDTDTAYAASLQTEETMHCIDSTGYNKIIYTELADRTQCLDT